MQYRNPSKRLFRYRGAAFADELLVSIHGSTGVTVASGPAAPRQLAATDGQRARSSAQPPQVLQHRHRTPVQMASWPPVTVVVGAIAVI